MHGRIVRQRDIGVELKPALSKSAKNTDFAIVPK
jgi:hypothetical protein